MSLFITRGKAGGLTALLALFSICCGPVVEAHPPGAPGVPVGNQVVPQNPSVTSGSATFTSQGSQLTIQTSDRAFINWGSFNIGAGASTVFAQPNASSVVWNRINDPNPSQILGHLDANGYVILQNQSGFYVGGSAVINAAGLVMTTTPTIPPDFSSGNMWQFNAPPPTASIINYGQINAGPGGSLFLIAHDIDNRGSLSAPGGNIGLYAGKEVLISQRPDGRSLTAAVTLPEGSVDNSGRLIADAGTIALHAQVVNQGGLIQANSVRENNGVIELVASDAVNLGAASVLAAKGDVQGSSPGGNVLIKSGGKYTDVATSTVDVSGGAQGGDGGQVEISAPQMNKILSKIDGHAAAGSTGGKLVIDPDNILLTDGGDAAPPSGTVNAGDPPSAGSPDTLTLDVNSFSSFSQISLQANRDIELNTLWTLNDQGVPGTLALQAGRNITLDDGSGILAGNNWTIKMTAGTELTSPAGRVAGSDGIYLLGHAFIEAQNGNIPGQPTINLNAANEIMVDNDFNSDNVSGNGIRTTGGGSISATAQFGDINTGRNITGYIYRSRAPFYSVAPDLGGISTAAGGDVTLSAGGDITSYLALAALATPEADAGAGAFGPQPGNVTITAGGSVFGHYVVANGAGKITVGQDAGGPVTSQLLALSLVKGSWDVEAPNGSINLQEVRNPNGVFNNIGNGSGPGYHLFDYDPASSVTLNAGNSVQLTGSSLPRNDPVLVLYPPTLNISAGLGGVVMDADVTLFPSPFGELSIASLGNFTGVQNLDGTFPTLRMSNSGRHNWTTGAFTVGDNASVPVELNNPNLALITVAGDMNDLNIVTSKPTTITVGGDMNDTSFAGENFKSTDITFINVTGSIFNRNNYTFDFLTQGIQGIPNPDPSQPTTWDSIFTRAVDPALVATTKLTAAASAQEIALALQQVALFSGGNPGFVYNPDTKRLGFAGQMSSFLRGSLEGPLVAVRFDSNGRPVLDANGHFITDPVTFVAAPTIEDLYQRSQDVPRQALAGYQIGGPGIFKINAGSLDLGFSAGILSWGIGGDSARYSDLASLINKGAEIDVTLQGDLNMFSSTIASFFGGDVNVTSLGGSLDLGSQELFGQTRHALGIYTSGQGNVNVIANKSINIDGSRIAAYDGGNVFVESETGNVNVGSGGTIYVNVEIVSRNANGQAQVVDLPIYGSGILTTSLPANFRSPGDAPLPGDITVTTPQGDIVSSSAGILQLALDGNVSAGPKVTLTAGTKPATGVPGFDGSIDLGDSGVIGGEIDLTASKDIHGLVISRQNSTINAAQNFSGTVLSAGTANVNAGGSVTGTVVGIGGVTATGANLAGATLLSQNVTAGGQTVSTLGTTATATAASTGASAQEQGSTSDKARTELAQNDDEEQKRKNARPLLTRTTGRVTVILPPK
jgi:filamentous hemagglutinin family protein